MRKSFILILIVGSLLPFLEFASALDDANVGLGDSISVILSSSTSVVGIGVEGEITDDEEPLPVEDPKIEEIKSEEEPIEEDPKLEEVRSKEEDLAGEDRNLEGKNSLGEDPLPMNKSENFISEAEFDSTQYSGIIIGIIAFVVGILVGKSLHRKGPKTSVKLKTKKVIKPEPEKSSEPDNDLSKGVKLDQEYID